MLRPFPHQLVGAQFLAERPTALLADEPRVGKTGAAIAAADMVWARRILVVTTASGRPVWAKAFRDWSAFGRSVQTLYKLTDQPTADVVIVGWSAVAEQKMYGRLFVQDWDVLILDESHYAKNPSAKRTAATFGTAEFDYGLCRKAKRTWCLTGTPVPNAPNDLYPMLRALCPARIDGMSYDAFMHRYCVVVPRHLGGRVIDVVKGGKNEAELAERLKGFFLRRTQKNVGITEPVYETFPLHIDVDLKHEADTAAILAAAESGDTSSLEMHLGPLRRLTGVLKAGAVIDAVKEEFAAGLDKIVLMAWHADVIDVLAEGLAEFEPVVISGDTSAFGRESALRQFAEDKHCGVFIGQMAAAGEAVDASAAAEMIFVEMSSVPAHMRQAAMRITNFGQKRQPRIRVAALEGSIDEALAEILTRKVRTIRAVLED
jgi:SWI/SNF-related matrix-associated actin-dependent regulator 1 of chromatin subfamily A